MTLIPTIQFQSIDPTVSMDTRPSTPVEGLEAQWKKNKKGMPVFKGKANCFTNYVKMEQQDSQFFSEVQRHIPFNTGLDPMNHPWDPAKASLLKYQDCVKIFKHRKMFYPQTEVHALNLKVPDKSAPFTDKQVEDYLGFFPNLTNLSLTNANITDRTVSLIAQKYPGMRMLSLENCAKITDKGLQALTRSCRDLEILNLNHCNIITETGLLPLLQHNRKIRKLLLEHCAHLTDKALSVIATTLPHLDAINLTHLYKVTSRGVVDLANGCPRLQFIVLYGCPDISNAAILYLAEKCKAIRTLNFGYNQQISDVEMERIIHICKRLEVLTLKDCPKIPSTFQRILRDHDIAEIREEMRYFDEIFTPGTACTCFTKSSDDDSDAEMISVSLL